MPGLLYPAYQKFYSAISCLERFRKEQDFFENISCLDTFFSEYPGREHNLEHHWASALAPQWVPWMLP